MAPLPEADLPIAGTQAEDELDRSENLLRSKGSALRLDLVLVGLSLLITGIVLAGVLSACPERSTARTRKRCLPRASLE